MSASIRSLIESGTKLYLDSIDPVLVQKNFEMGATGATSNPIIVADLIKSGRFDDQILELFRAEKTDEEIAWELADQLVSQAQAVFSDCFAATNGNEGYVSFELDPLLEDENRGLAVSERTKQYIELGKKWSAGHYNRMIKVPATPAGIAALPELTAAGVPLNVTLIFTQRQYEAARDAIWEGAQKLESLQNFKSVYSIFVSRIDVYTQQTVPELSDDLQGQVGIINAKRIWQANVEFWQDKNCPLQQEMIFASTGTKRPEDPAWKYVAALAGSDIQTNPPTTNDAVAESEKEFDRQIDQLPSSEILEELEEKVDFKQLEQVLMEQGLAKFCKPQHDLIDLIKTKRNSLASA